MLTPIDIQNQDFAVKFRGYDADEVDDFLDLLGSDYEKLYKENMDCKDRITKLEENLNQYKSIENTLQSTLLVAQSTGEQVQKNAEEKHLLTSEENWALSTIGRLTAEGELSLTDSEWL